MSLFVTRGRFTQSAIKGLVDNPQDREEVVRGLVEAAGGKLLHYLVTTGDADILLITEGDDGEMAVAAAMAAAAAGTITDLTTARAWTSAEFAGIARKAAALTGNYKGPG